MSIYDKRARNYARTILNNAIRDGEIFRPSTCEICDCPGKIEGHHTNYGDSLNVTWICRVCHVEIHMDKHHPLNPINHVQTVVSSAAKRSTYAKIEITIPMENYLVIKDRSERHRNTIEDQILRCLTQQFPKINQRKKQDDDTRRKQLARISKLVENETELPSKKLSGLSKSRRERYKGVPGMERFYSISSRHGANAK